MSQAEKAARFAQLHQKGNPLVLYNIWDAGSAQALAEEGAAALATGSWSVAAAQGFGDGEAIPLDLLLTIAERICASVDLPVSMDFEGGYAIAPDALAENAQRMLRTGAVGINFEDQIVKGDGLHPITDQAARVRALKSVTENGTTLFVNARTDLFLGTDAATHKDFLAEALERAAAYAEAGADCFFVPGLKDTDLIAEIAGAVSLPVNVMMLGAQATIKDMADLGVSRLSYGPGAYRQAMQDLKTAYAAIR